jgi:F420-0:gamma-glutamyl ligase
MPAADSTVVSWCTGATFPLDEISPLLRAEDVRKRVALSCVRGKDQ